MAQNIRVIISGESRGLEQAADRSGRAVRRLGDDIGTQNAKVSLLTRGAGPRGDLRSAPAHKQALPGNPNAPNAPPTPPRPIPHPARGSPGSLGLRGCGVTRE